MKHPIYLGATVWGREYCKMFFTYCLPSLLAEGNIPALEKNSLEKNRFIFATTADDWLWMQTQPIFLLLQQYIEVEFIPLRLITEENYQTLNDPLHSCKLYILTQGHYQLVNRMHSDKVIGSIIFPDSVYSDHALSTAYPYLQKEKKIVLFHCSRFSNTGILESLNQKGYINDGKPLEISSQDLIGTAFQNRNLEVLGQKWNKAHTSSVITDLWWPLPDNIGMLFHTLSWWYIFINYAELGNHNAESLQHNTIDGTYLYDNFNINDIYVLKQTDDFAMLTFSEDMNRKLSTSLDFDHLKPALKSIFQAASVRKKIEGLMYRSVDPLKLKLFKLPIFLHTKPLTPECHKIEKEAQNIVKKILAPQTRFQKMAGALLLFALGMPTFKQRRAYLKAFLKTLEIKAFINIKRFTVRIIILLRKIILPLVKLITAILAIFLASIIELVALILRCFSDSKK